MILHRLTLSQTVLRSIFAVLDSPTDDFADLAQLAELDPARDFRRAVLDGVEFRTDDLTGFDFSGADLTGADLTHAAGVDKMITDQATRLPDAARYHHLTTRPHHVLVVEEDPLILDVMGAALEDVGYIVTLASSGEEALNILGQGTKIDAVVTDYIMAGGMTGAELARQIRKIWADMPIMLCSGHSSLADDDDPGLPYLQKPFRPENLLSQVAKIISDRPVQAIRIPAAPWRLRTFVSELTGSARRRSRRKARS